MAVQMPPIFKDSTGQSINTTLSGIDTTLGNANTNLAGIITALQALSAPSATNVAVSPTGLHYITEDDAQGALAELDAECFALNNSLTQKTADRIIDENTKSVSGITWYYRKWASGILECWTTYTQSITFSSWGNVYSADVDGKSYPFSFADMPSVSVTGRYDYSAVATANYNAYTDTMCKTTSPKVTFMRGSSVTGSFTARIFVYAIGRYDTFVPVVPT